MNISYIEYDPVWGDPAANLRNVASLAVSVPDDVDLLVLPEMFTTGFVATSRQEALNVAELPDGPTLKTLGKIARKKHMAIAGSIAVNNSGCLFNQAFFILPSGEIAATYNKRHLFRMGGESSSFNAGSNPAPVVNFNGWRIKLIICYDLRFPVFCRNSEPMYDLLIVVANWPKARQTAWQTLLTARAIENLCYVCGVNRRGSDPEGIDYGANSSFVIDFKGKIISEPSAMSAQLSLDRLNAFRIKFPAHLDADNFTLL